MCLHAGLNIQDSSVSFLECLILNLRPKNASTRFLMRIFRAFEFAPKVQKSSPSLPSLQPRDSERVNAFRAYA